MKAMVLAAGLGTRLRPLTLECAKPAIPLSGQPLMCRLIERLRAEGVTEFRLNLHHLPHTIERVFESDSETDWPVSFSFEPEILGTAGGLKANESFFDDEPLIMVSGDIVLDFPLKEALAFHRSSGAIATLVLRPQKPPYQFTPLQMDKDGRLDNFSGLGLDNAPESVTYLFASVHILEPRIFDYIPPGRFWEIIKQAYPAAIAEGEAVLGYSVGQGYWNALDDAVRYLQAQRYLLRKEQDDRSTFYSTQAQIFPLTQLGPFVSIEEGCVVESRARVENSILWRNARVRSGISLKNCIIGSGVTIDADCTNRVVTRNGETSLDFT